MNQLVLCNRRLAQISSSEVSTYGLGTSRFTQKTGSIKIDHCFYHRIACHRCHGLIDLFQLIALADHFLERKRFPSRGEKVDCLQPVARLGGTDSDEKHLLRYPFDGDVRLASGADIQVTAAAAEQRES